MSHIGRNIRKIRTVKKMSQATFSELFHLARPSIGAYEEGRAEPKIDTVVQIANHFGLSIDLLLTKELTINDLFKFDLHATGAPGAKGVPSKSIKNPGIEILETSIVPLDKQPDYIVQHQNRDFMVSLPRIYVPGFSGKQFRAFEMNSEEMHDNYRGINRGDLVVSKQVEIGQLEPGDQQKIFVLVTSGEIIIRRISALGDSLRLIADHPGLVEKTLDKKAILEIWQAVGYFTTNLSAPSPLYDKMLAMERHLENLSDRIERMEGGKG